MFLKKMFLKKMYLKICLYTKNVRLLKKLDQLKLIVLTEMLIGRSEDYTEEPRHVVLEFYHPYHPNPAA